MEHYENNSNEKMLIQCENWIIKNYDNVVKCTKCGIKIPARKDCIFCESYIPIAKVPNPNIASKKRKHQ